MRCEQQELVAVKLSDLRNMRRVVKDVVTERRPGRMEARNSASAPCPMALWRTLGHGGTMCTQPIPGFCTWREQGHFSLCKFRCMLDGQSSSYRERT